MLAATLNSGTASDAQWTRSSRKSNRVAALPQFRRIKDSRVIAYTRVPTPGLNTFHGGKIPHIPLSSPVFLNALKRSQFFCKLACLKRL